MDEQLKREVRFITTRLGAMIREQAGAAVFDHVEQLRQLAKAIRAQHNRASIQSKRRLVAGLKTGEAYQVGDDVLSGVHHDPRRVRVRD